MKKVGFIINNLQIGGAERLLVDKINNFPKDYKVYLILLSKKNNRLLDEISENINIHILGDRGNFISIINLRKYLKKKGIKTVFSHLERPNKIALIASIFTKILVLPVVHNIDIYPKNNAREKLRYLVTKKLYEIIPKKIVAISEGVKNYLEKEMSIQNNIVLIKNGIDFSRINLERNITKNKIIFATLGRIVYVKGLDNLLKFLSDKNLINLNWHLKVIGDGQELNSLKEQAIALKIDDKIDFCGSHNNPFKLLDDVNFMLMPSRKEGLPISILETLSIGIPSIVNDVGSLSKVIKNGYNGYVVKNNDQWTTQLKYVININSDDYSLLSTNAIKSVDKYKIEKCIKKYIETAYG
tara:strand:+ start:8492 stop:9556 length:1065 start_codon:yes stop_codon:yes gene_type:complete